MTNYENKNQTEYKESPSVPPVKKESRGKKNRLASYSLLCGICALLNLCSISFPFSILMGVSAVFLAYSSKKEGSFRITAIAGILFGAAAVILGIAEFFAFQYVYDLMKKPELIPYFNEWFRQLEQLLSGTL